MHNVNLEWENNQLLRVQISYQASSISVLYLRIASMESV
jgi:hypothetical protein